MRTLVGVDKARNVRVREGRLLRLLDLDERDEGNAAEGLRQRELTEGLVSPKPNVLRLLQRGRAFPGAEEWVVRGPPGAAGHEERRRKQRKKAPHRLRLAPS